MRGIQVQEQFGAKYRTCMEELVRQLIYSGWAANSSAWETGYWRSPENHHGQSDKPDFPVSVVKEEMTSLSV